MFGDKNKMLKDVYNLARARHAEHSVGSTDRDKQLHDYIMELDYEDVKLIQTLMYLGRDRDYKKGDTPGEIYRKFRNRMDDWGWEGMFVETEIVMSKIPLDRYLRDAFDILELFK